MSLMVRPVGSPGDDLDSRRVAEAVQRGFAILPREPKGADVGNTNSAKQPRSGSRRRLREGPSREAGIAPEFLSSRTAPCPMASSADRSSMSSPRTQRWRTAPRRKVAARSSGCSRGRISSQRQRRSQTPLLGEYSLRRRQIQAWAWASTASEAIRARRPWGGQGAVGKEAVRQLPLPGTSFYRFDSVGVD